MQSLEFVQTLMPLWEMVLRLLAAGVLAATLGWEREAQNKAAGVRTHMLVGVGSCGFMLVVLALASTPTVEGSASLSIDPSRVIQGIIGGIGFLGAGAIIHGGDDGIRGLTTGAGIWLVGAMGLACAVGAYVLAVLITVFALVIIVICGRFAKPLIRPGSQDDKPGG